jgi:hypothetical protein
MELQPQAVAVAVVVTTMEGAIAAVARAVVE